jgi:hypothetical protein
LEPELTKRPVLHSCAEQLPVCFSPQASSAILTAATLFTSS